MMATSGYLLPPRRPAPALISPCCKKELDGGPVVHRCSGCGHDVHGSVLRSAK